MLAQAADEGIVVSHGGKLLYGGNARIDAEQPLLGARGQVLEEGAATASSQLLPKRMRRTNPTRILVIRTTLVSAATMLARTARLARWS